MQAMKRMQIRSYTYQTGGSQHSFDYLRPQVIQRTIKTAREDLFSIVFTFECISTSLRSLSIAPSYHSSCFSDFRSLLSFLKNRLIHESPSKHSLTKTRNEEYEETRAGFLADYSGCGKVCCIFSTLKSDYPQVSAFEQGIFLQFSRYVSRDISSEDWLMGEKIRVSFWGVDLQNVQFFLR